MAPKMQYGEHAFRSFSDSPDASVDLCACVVRLGNSGLKVSNIILGCMSYGSPEWQNWVLPEEEAIKHIKFAYVIYSRSCRTAWPTCTQQV